MSTYPSIYPCRGMRPILPMLCLSDEDARSLIGSVELGVSEKGFPAANSYFDLSTKSIEIPFRELMLCAGIALSPSVGISFSCWGFLVEHFHSFAKQRGRLRYSRHADNWDFRVKQMFAERMACGVAMWTLWNHDRVPFVADAGDFIRMELSNEYYAGRRLVNNGLFGKSGELMPDYFCLTDFGECVIVECKGTMGPPGNLSNGIKKGKEQVQNVSPTGVAIRAKAGRLVFATNIRGEHENVQSRADSSLCVADPIENMKALKVPINPDRLVVNSYCKYLSLIGRRDLCHSLMYEEISRRAEIGDEFVGEYNGAKFLQLAKIKGVRFGIQIDVAKALFNHQVDGAFNRVKRIISEIITPDADEHSSYFKNGIIIVPSRRR